MHSSVLKYLHNNNNNCNCINGKYAKLITIVISSAVTCITDESGATECSSITAITPTMYVWINSKCQAAYYTGGNAATTNLWITSNSDCTAASRTQREDSFHILCTSQNNFLHYSDTMLRLRGFSKWGHLYPSVQNTKAGKRSGTTTMAWELRLAEFGVTF